MHKKIAVFFTLTLSFSLLGQAAENGLPAAPAGKTDSLTFDPNKFTVKELTVDGKTINVRAYEGIVYVANPVEAKYQSLNFYAPAEYFEGKSVNGFTATTAPIFFPNSVGGYMPGLPATADKAGIPGAFGGPGGMGGPGMPPPDFAGMGDRPNTIAEALAHGYVVAAPGARGRTLKDASGAYTGKAPACIVDLKAAVRYLRHNDQLMPGDANKIISNGTSAGGALSALVGATGNSADYEPYLKAIGAAGERDDIFAASCYCPITDLDHADAAYEWLFSGVNTYQGRGGSGGILSAEQIKIADELKPLFPDNLNHLNLKKSDGTALTLDANGNGSFKEYVKSLVLASAQKALADGKDLSSMTWIVIRDGKVADIDFENYLAYISRQKTPPAFDALNLGAPENNLFGTATIDSQHFTEFGKNHSSDHTLADAAIVKLMNPLDYIGAPGVTTAPHWRIRHGTADRDTSLAVPTMLATKLQNSGEQVDFAMPWAQGHSGDYDLKELFAWIDHICQ